MRALVLAALLLLSACAGVPENGKREPDAIMGAIDKVPPWLPGAIMMVIP